MNKPITLCDRCKEYALCCLNYDGGNCRRARSVEPTNADRIRSMSDEEFSHFLFGIQCAPASRPKEWLDWLKQEADDDLP